jgi:lipopolysaccharide export system protein LptA
VWTPRRVLLLILGVCVFGCAYGVYARFLGGIDGLPQLPTELLTRRGDDEPFAPPHQTLTDRKLSLAFGPNCEEVAYSYKVELPAKGIVIATNQYEIDPDGRLRLCPFSMATIKERTPGTHPEINSIHCDVGYLEFDKPIKTLQEIGARRIVACELIGDPNMLVHDPRRGYIHLINNRSTQSADDDLALMTAGPVTYRESSQAIVPLDKARPEIQTAAAVQITDRRNHPQSTTVSAQGMHVYLAVDPPKPDAQRRPTRTTNVTGVRRVVLPSNVNMSLWSESGGGFLARTAPTPTADAAPPKGERTNLQIATIGSFTYDILPDGDRARFDCLPRSATPLPNSVRVVRPQVRGPNSIMNDQLECEHLELKFASKTIPNMEFVPPSKPADERPKPRTEQEKTQIEWVHAWGQYVVLTSDEERLEARGTELHHDAVAKTTTLVGVPETVAIKDGNEIHAPKLVIHAAEGKNSQHAEAVGSGHFRLLDRNGNQRSVHARWKDKLVYRKEDGRDELTLTGGATFEDKSTGQVLSADTLKLLLSADGKSVSAKSPTSEGTTVRPRPQRLEAFGRVSGQAPDLNIRDTDELIVHFKEIATPIAETSANPPASGAAAAPPAPAASIIPNRSNDPTKSKKPIELRARRIQAFLNTGPGDQTQLDRVDCEGRVSVHQDPTAPQTKPIDIVGQGLNLKHTAEGNILEVKGNLDSPGQVTLPELELIGPFIRLDQIENVAEVTGIGSMRIESQTDIQGKKLEKPAPLTITWKQKMRFNGQAALFHGHVQADQGDTSLLCNNMQVFLNKPVTLNPQSGQPRSPDASAANIDKVICDNQGQDTRQPVTITESIRAADGKLLRYQRIETNTLAVYKDEELMDAGPGSVRILRPGPAGNPLLTAKSDRQPDANVHPPEEFKLTWVRYGQRLQVDNKRRTAKFYKNVEVLHLPMDDPALQREFDDLANHPPSGAVFLRCERLDVYSSKDASDRTTQQEFTAKERAEVQAAEFSGRAGVIKFDEVKQLVIFEGTDGALAELYMHKQKGAEPQTIKAEKIIYNRKTGAFQTDRTRMITADGNSRP